MSASTATPRKSQSKPVTPCGATSTYMRVVQGKNRNPRKGMRNVSKVADHRTGCASHQTKIAARGPSKARMEIKQHMTRASHRIAGGARAPAPMNRQCRRPEFGGTDHVRSSGRKREDPPIAGAITGLRCDR